MRVPSAFAFLIVTMFTATSARAQELVYEFEGLSDGGGFEMFGHFAFDPNLIATDSNGQSYSLFTDPNAWQVAHFEYAYVTAYGDILTFDFADVGGDPQKVIINFVPGYLGGVIPTTTAPYPGIPLDFTYVTSASFSGALSAYGFDRPTISGTVTGVTLRYIDGGPFPPSGQLLTRQNASVPEPSSWAMMLVGFAAAGYVLRRRTVRRASSLK